MPPGASHRSSLILLTIMNANLSRKYAQNLVSAVQHDNARGPFKGGLRFHKDADLDDVRRYILPERVDHVTASVIISWPVHMRWV